MEATGDVQKNTEFSVFVRTARLEKKWTQDDLARKSGVSLRTISLIEGGGHLPRRAAVIQLANALDADSGQWLGAAKFTPVIPDAPPRSGIRGEVDPEEYFNGITTKLGVSKPGLMVPCYPCLPRLLEVGSMFKKWVELIDSGMWVALVFPYPASASAMLSNRPLTDFYQNVFNNLKTLADTLRAEVSADAKDRVRIFVPNLGHDSEFFPLMMPTMGLAEYRPMLVQFSGTKEEEKHLQGLVAWLRVNEQEKDRCISLYPDTDQESRGVQNIVTFRYWLDYFSDIITKWKDLKDQQGESIGWSSGIKDFGCWTIHE